MGQQRKKRTAVAKKKDPNPPVETPTPCRSPRKNGFTAVSNPKRVPPKFDESLAAKKRLDDDDTVSSNKSRRLTLETATVDSDPTPSTPSVEQVLNLISSTPGIDELLQKKYRPIMHPTPPGGESVRSLFLSDPERFKASIPNSPELESMSAMSSNDLHSSSNENDQHDESDEDEPMEVSDGVSLHSRNGKFMPEKPKYPNGKHLGRTIFTLAGRPEEEVKQFQCLFAAIRLDYVAAGPDPACLEGNDAVVDDQPLLELVQRRYTYIFGLTAPEMDPLLCSAVHPHITF